MDYVHNPIAFEHVAALDEDRLAIFDERADDFLFGRHQLVSALAGPRKPPSAIYVALARLEQQRRVGRALGLGNLCKRSTDDDQGERRCQPAPDLQSTGEPRPITR
jgi:hypothetical protein